MILSVICFTGNSIPSLAPIQPSPGSIKSLLFSSLHIFYVWYFSSLLDLTISAVIIIRMIILFVLFSFFLLQLLGLGILAVGIWAWSEKDTFNNLSRLTNVALDPAFILILIGKSLKWFDTFCRVSGTIYVLSSFSSQGVLPQIG